MSLVSKISGDDLASRSNCLFTKYEVFNMAKEFINSVALLQSVITEVQVIFTIFTSLLLCGAHGKVGMSEGMGNIGEITLMS